MSAVGASPLLSCSSDNLLGWGRWVFLWLDGSACLALYSKQIINPLDVTITISSTTTPGLPTMQVTWVAYSQQGRNCFVNHKLTFELRFSKVQKDF
jgi:hypothetical protein